MKTLDISTVEIAGIDHSDAPDYSDAYVNYAEWDDGIALTESELEYLNNDFSDGIYECIQDAARESLMWKAESAMDDKISEYVEQKQYERSGKQ